jgi:cytochrome c oxidase subunit 4
MSQAQSSLKAYIVVFGALLAMTALTVAVAYADVGRYGALLAVAIAGFKATLVAIYFMHLRSSSRLLGLYALSGIFLLGILVVIAMGEVLNRPRQEPEPLPPAAVHRG